MAHEAAAAIRTGTHVLARDAFGQGLPAVAESGIEGTHAFTAGRVRKVHDFPVIWVRVNDHRLPWPADAIRLHD